MADSKWTPRRWTAAALAVAAALAAVGVGTATGASATAASVSTRSTAATAAVDRTSAQEARRTAAVPTPRLDWYSCYEQYQCATARVPVDYDHPRGATTEIALLRYPARDQARRIGSLFVNPGGPGGSGTEMAYAAPEFLNESVLDRFDVVGFDPRGTNFSDQVACFQNNAAQSRALSGFSVAFPVTQAEEQATVRSARSLGRACSTTGQPLSASMSTAQVARDMDVLRRAMGDRKLSYLGFSYGSYLGQVYASLFPDRIRALAIDGVIDPVAWRGTPATAGQPQTDRLHSADGAYRALQRILVLCDRAGGQKCRFAPGDPVANYDLVARRLRRHPLTMDDPFFGPFRFSYADLVANTLGALYDPIGYAVITENLADLMILTEPPAPSAGAAASRERVSEAFVKRVTEQRARRPQRPGFGFPYENGLEAFSSVMCTDGANPADAGDWPAAAARADRRAKYFGRIWAWSSVQCASGTWTANDEDAYRGSFSHRTSAPVLVVGSTWDPATNVRGAVSAARLLPHSRLLRSDNWGHTAYGTSACATDAVNAYLLDGRLPKVGTVCHGDVQPFEGDVSTGEVAKGLRSAGAGRPPVVPPIPAPAG